MAEPRTLPEMPRIGLPEAYYAKGVHHADKIGDTHLREAYKVGQYVTLALDPNLSWHEKLRYFRHALKRHCEPPPIPDEPTWLFYSNLTSLVREHCGREALRLCSLEDDLYAARRSMGQDEEAIADDAEVFFANFIPPGEDACPIWFNETDFQQLKLLRDQWI